MIRKYTVQINNWKDLISIRKLLEKINEPLGDWSVERLEKDFKPYYGKWRPKNLINPDNTIYIIFNGVWEFHYKIHLFMHGDEIIIPYKTFRKKIDERKKKLNRILK